ncbi:MAG: hypothetical protein JWP51_2894 [Bradyrhizobium sp.]|jgi:hypothetical protein|nr:hypothetical protein [Bradyrhizobium sp.]
MDVEGGGEVSEYDRKCSQRFRAFPNNSKMIRFSVMAGQKRVFALDVPAIHVFLAATLVKTWMPGTSPGMTSFIATAGSIGCILSQTLRRRRLGHR